MIESGSLPQPLTSLIGREDVVATVSARLQAQEARLLTLTGPGGIGKTRLALAVAKGVAPYFRDGVHFVALASLQSPDFVASTLAQELGIRETGSLSPVGQLISALRDRHTLLILDNFEHLLAAAPILVDVLAVCPQVTVLVTSRALLSMSGEQVFPVPPLALPSQISDQGSVTFAVLADAPAIQLFVARAHAVHPDFALSPENVDTVASICRDLDGLPLAIELAAARVRHLPLTDIAERLAHRLPLLTGGPRNQPARLQTMRDAIAWSHDLLTADQQRLFRRLAVFRDGFTLTAAESVVTGGEEFDRELLDGISDLVDQSLLIRGDNTWGEPRFGMLETIRAFAIEQLMASGEAADLRDAHAVYYLALSERADREHPDASRDVEHMPRLGDEQDNLRAALTWLEMTGDREGFLRLATSAGWLWRRNGRYREGLHWVERALGLATDAPPADRMRAYRRQYQFLSEFGRSAEAKAASRRSLDLARDLGNCAGMGWAFLGMAVEAEREGDLARSGQLHQEALICFRDDGNTYGLAHVLSNLGNWAYLNQDYAQAITWSREALAIAQGLPDAWYVTGALNNLGEVALEQRDVEEARGHYLESAQISIDIDDTVGVVQALAGLAGVAALTQRPLDAVRWLSSVKTELDRIGTPATGNDLQMDRALATARAALSRAVFDTAWTIGRSVPIAQALADAISLLTAAAPDQLETNYQITAPASALSAREMEVLRLLHGGGSDRQIAEKLSVSRKTVSNHVSNILRKLDVETRTGAVTQAIRDGLL